MPDAELGLVERATLLTLVAEAREVANASLTKRHLSLKKDHREKLAKLGLVTVRYDKNRYYWELTERGWKWCVDELGAPLPKGAGSMTGAFYTWLENFQRHLERYGLSLAEVFTREGPVAATAPAKPAADLETEIRRVYVELAQRPRSRVRLADLRMKLAHIERSDLDQALVRLSLEPDVSVESDANQKALTPADRDAAVTIGNQDKHVIAIGV